MIISVDLGTTEVQQGVCVSWLYRRLNLTEVYTGLTFIVSGEWSSLLPSCFMN